MSKLKSRLLLAVSVTMFRVLSEALYGSNTVVGFGNCRLKAEISIGLFCMVKLMSSSYYAWFVSTCLAATCMCVACYHWRHSNKPLGRATHR